MKAAIAETTTDVHVVNRFTQLRDLSQHASRGYSLNLADHGAADYQSLDFGRTFVDLGYALVPVHALDGSWFEVADTAVNLDGFVDVSSSDFGGVEFGFCGFGAVRESFVVERGGPVGKESGGVELSFHIGEHELYGLFRGEWSPKCVALFGVRDSLVERAFCQT